jgi:hypothetical protein
VSSIVVCVYDFIWIVILICTHLTLVFLSSRYTPTFKTTTKPKATKPKKAAAPKKPKATKKKAAPKKKA